MSLRIPVLVSSAPGARGADDDRLAPYRVAVAELPLSAQLASSATGAVVVIDARGSGGWLCAVEAALADGARGVVVDEAVVPDAGCRDRLPAGGGHVLAARCFLPRDLVEAARALVAPSGSEAVLVAVEVGGPSSSGVLRDALGWARVLTGGGELGLGSVFPENESGPTASLLLESHDGIPVLFSWAPDAGAPWLRVSALGAVEVEVAIDAGAGVARLTSRSAEGERVVRDAFEGRARRELRCAIEAPRASDRPDELLCLLEDLELSGQIERGCSSA
ncbi:hypothetical protein [Pseudoclavibacter sp. VKM Ac-2867]|uniref:hypothetical protein n=1 Tax=Pseudoclavibacter sp. VKM Ac-2867 TaxID=2783829 RepID=UPI00188C2643|nr:hypothetical protein [Pseudoclavibacter sp. VKM Ac-2867]MBF4460859.1 hypothetical protein [Pseudoclavibacter sp. VKM Ac-2867]